MRMDPSERRWTSPAWLVTGAIVLVVVAVIVTLLVVRGQGSAAPDAAPTSTPPPSQDPPDSAPTAGETYESACGLRGGSLQQPTEQPADISWQRVEGWAYPISPSAGPGRRDPAGPWSCFARTPTGAVIAAYTINARLGLAADFESVVQRQTVPGVGQQALLRSGQPEAETGVSDTKGFVIESYSNDQAVVSLFVVNAGNSFTCSVEVVWQESDWRIRLLPDGSSSSGCVESAPTRYVRWGER